MFITAVGIIGAGIDGTAAFIMAGIILITVMDTMATGTTIMIDIDGDIPIIIEEPHTEVIT
jgi:hypothetical protein